MVLGFQFGSCRVCPSHRRESHRLIENTTSQLEFSVEPADHLNPQGTYLPFNRSLLTPHPHSSPKSYRYLLPQHLHTYLQPRSTRSIGKILASPCTLSNNTVFHPHDATTKTFTRHRLHQACELVDHSVGSSCGCCRGRHNDDHNKTYYDYNSHRP
jgi:hypothetical protein